MGLLFLKILKTILKIKSAEIAISKGHEVTPKGWMPS